MSIKLLLVVLFSIFVSNLGLKYSYMKLNEPISNTQRLYSLDALRGFDMFFITGGEALFSAIALLTGFTCIGSQM